MKKKQKKHPLALTIAALLHGPRCVVAEPAPVVPDTAVDAPVELDPMEVIARRHRADWQVGSSRATNGRAGRSRASAWA